MLDSRVIEINKYVCGECNLREDNTGFKYINNSINIALNSNEENQEELIRLCLTPSALIKLFQPFYDGNHRTGLILFGGLLESKGFEFNYEEALNDMNNHKLNLPTFYYENDVVGNIEPYLKYIGFPLKK